MKKNASCLIETDKSKASERVTGSFSGELKERRKKSFCYTLLKLFLEKN